MNSLEIARMAAEFKPSRSAARTAPQQRVKIIAGTRSVGDKIGTLAVSSFGRVWSEIVADHEVSAYGLEPGRDHRVTFQYAYLS